MREDVKQVGDDAEIEDVVVVDLNVLQLPLFSQDSFESVELLFDPHIVLSVEDLNCEFPVCKLDHLC